MTGQLTLGLEPALRLRSRCCRRPLEHLHGRSYRCPGCNAGYDHHPTTTP